MHLHATVVTSQWLDGFYRSRHQALAAYAAILTGSRSDAEDLVHEALLSMLAIRHPITAPEAYAFRAIRNKAADRARQARRTPSFHPGRSIEVHADTPQPDDLLALQAALDTLPAASAEVVVLHARAGLTLPQVALVLDQPLGTVSARYFRALEQLRAELTPEAHHG
ncbi:MAG: sigma-70 family RNA polymerase sigma factor [Phycisphaerales bacterium]